MSAGTVVRVAARVLLVALATAALLAVLPAALGWRTADVATGSMRPALGIGDVVVLAPPGTGPLRVGQIVAFHPPARPHAVEVHRVAAVRGQRLITRGDANRMPDSAAVPRADVLGVVRLRVPYVGWLRTLSPAARAAGSALAVLLAFGLIVVAAPIPRRTRLRPGPRTAVHVVAAVLLVATPVTAPTALATFTARVTDPGTVFGAAEHFDTYPQAVLADSPSFYYRQDDSAGSTVAADDSGNGANGAYSGSASTFREPGSPADPSGAAVTFPGGSATASHAYSDASSSPTVCTAEAWFKTATTAGGKLIGFGQKQNGNSFLEDREIGMLDDGQLQAFAGNTKIRSSASYNDGRWHMAAMSVGPAGLDLYVDGALVASSSGQTSGQTFSGYWRIGGDSFFDSSSAYFAATIDEAGVYTTQLPAARIAAHYAAATSTSSYTASVLSDSPWGFWQMDDRGADIGSGVVLADSSGSDHPGHYANMPTPAPMGGQPGALSGSQASSDSEYFPGVSNGYSAGPLGSPGVFSVECWFRTTTSRGGDLLGYASTQTGLGGTRDRMLYLTNDGKLTFGIGAAAHTISSATAYNDGAWHEVVATLGSAGSALYVDGATVAADTTEPDSARSFDGYWRWGGTDLSGWPGQHDASYFTGYLDEVAIYSTQLTATQVTLHYGAAGR